MWTLRARVRVRSSSPLRLRFRQRFNLRFRVRWRLRLCVRVRVRFVCVSTHGLISVVVYIVASAYLPSGHASAITTYARKKKRLCAARCA